MATSPIELRLARLEGAYEQIDERLGGIDARLARLEDGLDGKVNGLRSKDSLCPVCREEPIDIVAQLSVSWVTAPTRAPLPGYVAVVSKRHVGEPFELPPVERAAFWEDILIVACSPLPTHEGRPVRRRAD